MIRRMIAASLALLLTPALSFAQVVGRSATAAPGVVGSVGASISAPALSPLSGPSALAPSLGVAPSLAIPALTPAPALAPIRPAASKAATEPIGEGVSLPHAVGKGHHGNCRTWNFGVGFGQTFAFGFVAPTETVVCSSGAEFLKCCGMFPKSTLK